MNEGEMNSVLFSIGNVSDVLAAMSLVKDCDPKFIASRLMVEIVILKGLVERLEAINAPSP